MSSERHEVKDISQTPIGKALQSIWDLLKDLKAEENTELKQEKIAALTQLLSLILIGRQSPQQAVNQVKKTYPYATHSSFFKNSRVNTLFKSLSTVTETYVPSLSQTT